MSCVTESNQPCEYKMGVDYKLGLDEQGKSSTTRIRFKATDAAGNSAFCRFKVIIEGNLNSSLSKDPSIFFVFFKFSLQGSSFGTSWYNYNFMTKGSLFVLFMVILLIFYTLPFYFHLSVSTFIKKYLLES